MRCGVRSVDRLSSHSNSRVGAEASRSQRCAPKVCLDPAGVTSLRWRFRDPIYKGFPTLLPAVRWTDQRSGLNQDFNYNMRSLLLSCSSLSSTSLEHHTTLGHGGGMESTFLEFLPSRDQTLRPSASQGSSAPIRSHPIESQLQTPRDPSRVPYS